MSWRHCLATFPHHSDVAVCEGFQHKIETWAGDDSTKSITIHFSQKEPQEVSKPMSCSKQDQVQSSDRLYGASSIEF